MRIDDTYWKSLARFHAPTPLKWDGDLALHNLGIHRIPFVPSDLYMLNLQGYSRGKSIAVRPDAKSPDLILLHELAHHVLGHTKMEPDMGFPRGLGEVEAESVAIILRDVLRLRDMRPIEMQGPQYVSAWASLVDEFDEVPETSIHRIFAAASVILKAGQKSQTEEA